jgi:hypothetical protein
MSDSDPAQEARRDSCILAFTPIAGMEELTAMI